MNKVAIVVMILGALITVGGIALIFTGDSFEENIEDVSNLFSGSYSVLISDSNGCGSLEDGSWNTGMTRTYSYTINSDSGTVSLDGKWFDGASTCAKFYMSM